jgi:sugar phosphate permease
VTTQSNPQQPAQRRWRIGGLLGIGVLVNYFDRISLSVAAPQLQQEFHLSSSDLGLLFSIFLDLCAAADSDRADSGPLRRNPWPLGCPPLGVASTLTACAGGFGGIFAARALLGVAEAPGFPVSAKATGYWFPRRERAMATAIFDAAAKFSNVIGVPLVALTVVHLGWRWGFGLTALLSVAYFIAFTLIYRDPSQDSKLSDSEYRYIVDGGAAAEGTGQAGSLAMLGYLLQQRKVWGLSIGFAAYGYVFYLFLTWLPGYLVQTMHMSILKSASYAAIPWIFATLSDLLVGGWLIDHLIGRGHDETRVRKGVLLGGMLLGLAVFGTTTTNDPTIAIIWITIALSGLAAAAPVGWSLPPDCSARRYRHRGWHHEFCQ